MGVQLKRGLPPRRVSRRPTSGTRASRGEVTSAAQRACPRNSSATPTTMTLTDPAEGRAWAVWLLDHEPAA